MKNCSPVARFILSAVTVLVVERAGAAQHSVPFKGTLQGSFTATPVPPFPPQFVDVLLTATGNATQLGGFTAVFPHRVELSNRIGAGTYTFTAANGDTLVADVFGQATEVAPNVLRVVEMGTITGGTGRFADASGEFVVERLLDQVNFTTIGRFQETVSVPRAGKR